MLTALQLRKCTLYNIDILGLQRDCLHLHALVKHDAAFSLRIIAVSSREHRHMHPYITALTIHAGIC